MLLGADVGTVSSSIAAASEDHIPRILALWQAFQQQVRRWRGFGIGSAADTGGDGQQGQLSAHGSHQTRLAAWGQHALLMQAAISAREFLEGEELERTGAAEGQLSAEAFAALAQKPYDAQQYAAQRAAAWEQAITD